MLGLLALGEAVVLLVEEELKPEPSSVNAMMEQPYPMHSVLEPNQQLVRVVIHKHVLPDTLAVIRMISCFQMDRDGLRVTHEQAWLIQTRACHMITTTVQRSLR
jgi:hypothetical protein